MQWRNLPKVEAITSENEGNKNKVDRKLWDAMCGLRKNTRNLKAMACDLHYWTKH